MPFAPLRRVLMTAAGGAHADPSMLVAPAATVAVAPPRALFSGRQWLNSRPLKTSDLRGKVVLVNFWTHSRFNSLRPLPYVRSWAKKYGDRGLLIVGVHTPEFGFEKDSANVRRALRALHVRYPVVLDSDYRIWNAFGNQAWPAFYFIGSDGRVHRQILGEGQYEESEKLIQTLLSQARGKPVNDPLTQIERAGPQAAPDWRNIRSEETYVGYAKAKGFALEDGLKQDGVALYRAPVQLGLNQWSLTGKWKIGPEYATLADNSGAIAYHFHGQALNLVMGPPPGGPSMWFVVKVDGAPPGVDHGSDTDFDGWGLLDQARMYQLVHHSRPVADRTLEIEFFGPGARAYVFTFG